MKKALAVAKDVPIFIRIVLIVCTGDPQMMGIINNIIIIQLITDKVQLDMKMKIRFLDYIAIPSADEHPFCSS